MNADHKENSLKWFFVRLFQICANPRNPGLLHALSASLISL